MKERHLIPMRSRSNGKEKFTPIYSLPSNVKDSTYRQFVNYVYDYASNNNYINTLLPLDLLEKYKL